MYTLNETLLKVSGVNLSYGSKAVLRDINIEIKDIIHTGETKGQVTTLLGKSGSGKSQLFKLLAGMNKPSSGEIFVGKDQKAVSPGMVGMVLQNYPLFAHYTMFGNLRLVSKDKAKIDSYLNDFDIYEHRNKYPKELSGGQRQRAAILQQLLCSDHFMLLDEPFSGLDPVSTEKLCKVVNKIANEHEQNTVIISSHILEPSLAISDSVWILGNGIDDPEKKLGSTIKHTFDLAANGLAWNSDIRKDPRFTIMVEYIRNLFQTL